MAAHGIEHFDAIVIGAGLAGASAAALLSERGLGTCVVEARERVGGRGFSRPYAGAGEVMEFGGAWITPWQWRIRAHCARHGVALRPRHPVVERRWFHDGVLHRDAPVSAAAREQHERALALVAAHAALLKAGAARDAQGRAFADISFAAYLDLIEAPPATRSLLSAWWAVSGSGDKLRVPVSELLHSIGYHDGTPDGVCEVWADTLLGGVQSLSQRMITANAAQLRLGAAATRIDHGRDGVQVHLADGATVAARAVVVATGLNPLSGITFDPPLPASKSAAVAAGHLGRAVKVWARVGGVAPGALVTGGDEGIEWMFSERPAAAGASFVVGFGVAANGWSPLLPADAERAVKRFFPEAIFLDCDWHDWNADPFARGTWVSGIVGRPELHAAGNWSRLGRLAFASSDIAAEDAGWFEGAIVSGEAAAAELLEALAAA